MDLKGSLSRPSQLARLGNSVLLTEFHYLGSVEGVMEARK